MVGGSTRRLIRGTRLPYAKWLFEIAQELCQYSVRNHDVRRPEWVKRVGPAMSACLLHPQLRTYGSTQRTDALGQQETSARFLRREGSRLLEKAGVASVATTGC